MPPIRTIFPAALVAAIALGSCSSSTSPTAVSSYHIVTPSTVAPYGHTWEGWQSLWWNWVFSMDSSHHPLRESAPLDTMQLGHGHDGVWFLGGAFYQLSGGTTAAVRHGTVPYGTALYFPISNGEDDLATDNTMHSDSDMLRAQMPLVWMAGEERTAEIDGDPVLNIEGYLSVEHQTFQCYLVPNSLDACPAGWTSMLSDGYYLLLDNLSRGDHTIHFRRVPPGTPANIFDITYILKVQ